MQLYIGNKNYSSWSMRPWVLMTQAGIAFEERMLRFDSFGPDSSFKREIARLSPAARVPLLVDRGFAVWDSLAIAEYLAERFPERRLWPEEVQARARARSICAEMHVGFSELRSHFPMNIEASLPEVGQRVLAEQAAVRADLARIEQMWGELLDLHGGPFLFGRFSIPDAYFAPICTRLRTYAVPQAAPIEAYVERVMQTPAVQTWVKDALAEQDFVAFDEPYRKSREG